MRLLTELGGRFIDLSRVSGGLAGIGGEEAG
jgi:hypothetical protein